MQKKLALFTQFAASLFPHELEYLLAVQKFEKPLNLSILKQICRNNIPGQQQQLPFNTSIDKRTYSYLKKWITETLLKIDVDYAFEWLIGMEKKVLTDIIVPADEAEILEKTNRMLPDNYNFIRFYELLLYYRNYLMVRNRTKHIVEVVSFLEKHHEQYLYLKDINNQLDDITTEIVKNKTLTQEAEKETEQFLLQVFYNEKLDSYTRYRAVVRLTIFYYNNRQFDKQLIIYKDLDELLKTPLFYSKRILSNYYANRAMMHAKLNEPELSEKYGYLSIQNKNSDYLFYLINLCGVLIKQNKKDEVLKLMRNSIPELKNTNNIYYKIGFASFYIRTLVINEQLDKAEQYATQYFETYKKEIFEHRWHLYLSSYFYALLLKERYRNIILITNRYHLIARERQRIKRPDYLPIIEFYYYSSEYLEGLISRNKLMNSIKKIIKPILPESYRLRRVGELLNELMSHFPDEIKEIKQVLKLK